MTRWAAVWIALLALPASFEVWTLLNDVPADTLSHQVWTLLEAQPVAAVPLAAFLAWLAVHWLGGRGKR